MPRPLEQPKACSRGRPIRPTQPTIRQDEHMITSETTLAVCTALYLPSLNGFIESLLVFAEGHQIPDRGFDHNG
jgi:hypothetical protein